MKLKSVKIYPRHSAGWESPLLEFGDRTTSLFAPNGSGKTPIVQAIAFCLGFDIRFRDDIREHSEAAELTVVSGDTVIQIKRNLETKSFCVTSNRQTRIYDAEADFSKALFSDLGVKLPTLVSTAKKPTHAFVSTVLPIFYVRQDGGYLGAYSAPATFIADQFVEMIRLIFGFAPKRSYDAQKELLAARIRLEAAQRRIVFQQQVVTDMSTDVDDSPINQNFLRQRSVELTHQIEELRSAGNKRDNSGGALIELLQAKEERLRISRRTRANLQSRVDGIESIRNEIEGEVKTLNLNEESRRVFQTFGDICGRPDCGLFLSSQNSYGKNLLYLKDQIKDLENNVSRAQAQLEVIDTEIRQQEAERDFVRKKLQEANASDETSALVIAVQNVTRELMSVEQQRIVIERLSAEKKKYLRLDEERFRVQDEIALLSNSGRADLQFNELRMSLQQLTVKWMDILSTPNVPRIVHIELDFRFRFGNEFLDVFTGSTRARLVLAIHAAIFEKYMEDKARPFRFLILDTPKQHELESSDLARYLAELQKICDEGGGQIVISSTEYRHPIGAQDREWLPEYPGPEKMMYLGKPTPLG